MFDMRVELKHFNKDNFLQKQSELDRPFYAGVSHMVEFILAIFYNSTSLVLTWARLFKTNDIVS